MNEKKKRLLIVGICLLVLVAAGITILLLSGKPKQPEKKPVSYEELDNKPGNADTNEPEKPDDTDPDDQEEESEKPDDTDPDDQEEEPEKPDDTDPDDQEEEPEKPDDTDPDDQEEEPEKPDDTDPDDQEEEPENPDDTDPDDQEEEPEKPDDTDPDDQEEEPEKPDDTDPDDQEEITPPPDDIPPEVVIPDDDEEEGLQFPCEVPGHNLTIEKLAPYTGIFVEDGTNQQVTDVAMLLVHNNGDSAVEYTEITVEYKEKNLTFCISALPAGETMVVQEKSGSSVPEGVALSASALVIHRTQMGIAQGLSVSDNGDNSMTVKNLTDKTIPAIRVFYKYYMEDEDLFVGGIAFTVRITRLAGGASVVIRPSHYTSQTSRVVMALTYDA